MPRLQIHAKAISETVNASEFCLLNCFDSETHEVVELKISRINPVGEILEQLDLVNQVNTIDELVSFLMMSEDHVQYTLIRIIRFILRFITVNSDL